MILAELAMEAGLPDGVLNIVHGTNVCPHISVLLSISSCMPSNMFVIKKTVCHKSRKHHSVVLTEFCCSFFQDTVNAICDDEDIRAVSFVGSNTVSPPSSILTIPSVSYLVSGRHFQFLREGKKKIIDLEWNMKYIKQLCMGKIIKHI